MNFDLKERVLSIYFIFGEFFYLFQKFNYLAKSVFVRRIVIHKYHDSAESLVFDKCADDDFVVASRKNGSHRSRVHCSVAYIESLK